MVITLITLNYRDVEGCKKICEQAQGIDIIDNIIIVDNMSNDGSYEKLCNIKNNKIRVVQSKKNGGYSYGYNYGLNIAKEMDTEYVFICNSDILFDEVLIKECIDFLQKNDRCGAVSARQFNILGEECVSAWKFPKYSEDLRFCSWIYKKFFYKSNNKYETIGKYQKVDAVSGCFTCFRMDSLVKVGMYDDNVFLYNEENIVSKRLQKAGFYTYRLNYCSYIHNHKRKRGVTEINYKKILQVARSGYYYQTHYNNISMIKKCIFWVYMHIGVFETYMVNFVKLMISRR